MADAPATSEALAPTHPWYEANDEDGNTYYWNADTNQVQWEKPAVPGFESDGAHFDAVPGAEDDALSIKMHEALKLAKMDPETLAKLKEAKEFHKKAEAARDAAVEAGHGHWVEVYDPGHDAYYYCESYTHEVVWDKPEHYVMAADDETMSAVIKIQCLWRSRQARKALAAKKSQSEEDAELAAILMGEAQEKKDNDNQDDEEDGEEESDGEEEEEEEEEDVANVQDTKATPEEKAAAIQIQKSARGKLGRSKATKERTKLSQTVATSDFGEFASEVTEDMQQKWTDQYDAEAFESRMQEQAGDMADVLKSKSFGQLNKHEQGQIASVTGCVWVQQWDPSCDSHYYYNTETGENTFERPADFQEGSKSETLQAATKIQSAFRGGKSRAEVAEKVEKHKEYLRNLWVEQYDPQTQTFYYFNTKTKQSVKERPLDYLPGGNDDSLIAVIKIQCAFRSRQANRKVDDARRKREEAEEELFTLHVLRLAFPPEQDDSSKVSSVARRRYVAFNRFQRDSLTDQKEQQEKAQERADAINLTEDEAAKLKQEAEDVESMRVTYRDSTNKAVELARMATQITSFEDVEEMLANVTATLQPLSDSLYRACRAFVAICLYRIRCGEERLSMPKEELEFGRPVVAEAGEVFARRQKPFFERLQLCIEGAEFLLRQARQALRGQKEENFENVVESFFDWYMQTQEALSAVHDAEAVANKIKDAVRREKERQEEAKARVAMQSQEKQQRLVQRILGMRKQQAHLRRIFIEHCQRGWQRGMELRVTDAEARKSAEDEARRKEAEEAIRREEEARRRREARDAAQTLPWQAAKDGCAVATLDRLLAQEARRRQKEEGYVIKERVHTTSGQQSLTKTVQGMSGAPFDIDTPEHGTGENILRNAVWYDHAHLVRHCISLGADVNRSSGLVNKLTPLHEAARAGFDNICQILLEHGAHQDAQDGHGDTPLHWAARKGHLHTVRTLLNFEPDPHAAGLTRRWKSVGLRNLKNRRAIDLTRVVGIRHLLEEADVVLPSRVREEEVLQQAARERAASRRSRNVNLIRREQGGATASASGGARLFGNQRLASLEDTGELPDESFGMSITMPGESEAGSSKKKKKKKKKKKQRKEQADGVIFQPNGMLLASLHQ